MYHSVLPETEINVESLQYHHDKMSILLEYYVSMISSLPQFLQNLNHTWLDLISNHKAFCQQNNFIPLNHLVPIHSAHPLGHFCKNSKALSQVEMIAKYF